MGTDTPGCLCVAHVFGHVLKYQKITEQKPALHCKTKTLLVSFRRGGGKLWGRNGGSGLSRLSAAEQPSRQIVCVSWGMEREALLWFWSTDQCQAWSTSLALRSRGWWLGGGGNWRNRETGNEMTLTSSPVCPRADPGAWDQWEQQRRCWMGGRGVWFQPLGPLFGSLGAHDFRVIGSRLRRAPAASLLAMITPWHTHTHTLCTLTRQQGLTLLFLGLDCCSFCTTGDI